MSESSRIGFVRLSNQLLGGLLVAPLTAVQLRVALWVLRQTVGWNRPLTKFTWYGIAKDLCLDRAGVLRAGRTLLDGQLLYAESGRIGIEPNPVRWNIRRRLRVTGITDDVRPRFTMTRNSEPDVPGQPPRGPGAPLCRRAIDTPKHQKPIHQDRQRGAQKRNFRGWRISAGAAEPIPNKYERLSEDR
jgi:phage replication O-like protein O